MLQNNESYWKGLLDEPSDNESYWKGLLDEHSWVLFGIEEDPFWMYKGAGHKYTARLNNKNPPPKYKYIYGVPGKGIVKKEHLHEGARFKGKHEGVEGHFTIKEVKGDPSSINPKILLHHDGTGKELEITYGQLYDKIHHITGSAKDAIKEKTAKLFEDYKSAQKYGTAYHKENMFQKLKQHIFGYYGADPFSQEMYKLYDIEQAIHKEKEKAAEKQKKKEEKQKQKEAEKQKKKEEKQKQKEESKQKKTAGKQKESDILFDLPDVKYTDEEKDAYAAPKGSTKQVALGHGSVAPMSGGESANKVAKHKEALKRIQEIPDKAVTKLLNHHMVTGDINGDVFINPDKNGVDEVWIKHPITVDGVTYNYPHREHPDAYDFSKPVSTITDAEIKGAIFQLTEEIKARKQWGIIHGNMGASSQKFRSRAELAILTGTTLFSNGNVASVRNPEKFNPTKASSSVNGPDGWAVKKPTKRDYQIANEIMTRLSYDKLPTETNVVRGLSLDTKLVDKLAEAIKKGEMTEPLNLGQVSSWTYAYNRSTALNFAKKDLGFNKTAVVLEMVSDRGTDITQMSRYVNEKEIVIGGKVRVKKVYKIPTEGVIGIQVELVPEDETSKSFWKNLLIKSGKLNMSELQAAFSKEMDYRTFPRKKSSK